MAEQGNLGPDHERPTATAADQPIVTTDDAMTLASARTLSGRRGARLVLVMGEAATGKTALLAALWQRLLERGELAGHSLAGSRTALGFERRAHWGRLDAGTTEPSFPPSPAEEALLHLRVRRPDGERVELLLADLSGEQFERVREGRSLSAELPWAARLDRAIVVVDAQALARQGESEIAITRAQRLVLALQTSSAVRDSARIALVLTKADALGSAGEQALARHESPLAEIARQSDPEATWIRTAALANGTGEPDGLGALIAWLCGDDRPATAPEAPAVALTRSIATFRA
jgi:hypothetical protein